jgi:PEP-CTERM motif
MIAKIFSRRLGLFGLAFAAMCVAAFLSSTASAAVLAYDPFLVGPDPSQGEYLIGRKLQDGSDSGATLGGQNPVITPPSKTGGTGFYSGAWVQSGGDSQVVGNAGAGSLHYPDFPRDGKSVREAIKYYCCIFGRTGRALTSPLGGGRNPRTIYNSFLIDFGNISAEYTQYFDANGALIPDPNDPNAPPVDHTAQVNDPNDVNTHDVNAGKRGYELWNGGIGDANLATQVYYNYYSGDRLLTLATRVQNPAEDPNNPNDDFIEQKAVLGPGYSIPELAASGNGVHLVVLKFEFDPNNPDVVSVYLDPTNSVEGDWTPAASLSVATSNLAISHQSAYTHFSFTGNDQAPGAIDEIRWGDTFADVTPFVPEPATLTLAGLSAIGILLSRRRKQT